MDLRTVRSMKGLSQAALSRQAEVFQSKISRAESGQNVLRADEEVRIQKVLEGVVNWTETYDPDQAKKRRPWTAEARDQSRRTHKRRMPKMSEEQIEVVALFAGDTKRWHRYDLKGEIGGSLYFSKEDQVPKTLVVTLKVKAD